MNELDKLRLKAYETTKLYKEKTKKWSNQRIKRHEFHKGEKVLVYKSRLHLFPEKLCSRIYSPLTMVKVFPHGVFEQKSNNRNTFQINGHKVYSRFLDFIENLHDQIGGMNLPFYKPFCHSSLILS